ncbi:MAG: LON peptidase substrate-binding domain-containing protein [Chloroflexi bacterium]|nr:LON peptidase substrate-binding domain-containing protein [Chloroflexota bacterium]
MELPLFPLNTVLFPGAAIPLHVFEERYKLLTKRCLENNEPFGVALIRSGEEAGGPADPFPIGTTARIVRVQQAEEGRLNLIAVGGQRFRIQSLVHKEPYLVGEVDTLDSVDENAARDLAGTVGSLFAEYYRLYLALSDQWTRAIGLPGSPADLSDFVAARLPVGLWVKQRLLETLSVPERLSLEVDILSDTIRNLTVRVAAARAEKWRGFGAMS